MYTLCQIGGDYLEKVGALEVCRACGAVFSDRELLFTLTAEQLDKYLRLSKKADEMGEKP